MLWGDTFVNDEEKGGNIMKAKVLAVALATVLVAGWGIASGVLAADKAEVRSEATSENYYTGSLGTATGATDVWHVQCGYGSYLFGVAVGDMGGVDGIRMTVLVMDSGTVPAGSAIAPDGGASPAVYVIGGAGAYYVFISKTGFGTTENYDTAMQCFNASGGYMGTYVTLVQNQ